jgi:TolB-like protein/DNA-binding winged helix-turn-helix (wHTH) protein
MDHRSIADPSMNPSIQPHRLRFGPFVLDTRRVELLRDGAVVPLRPKPFALLTVLARNPGTVLSKEALLAAVWPGTVVTEDSLTQAVRDVRMALGDAGAHWVHTVARHGYRFDADVVDVEALGASDERAATPPADPAPAGVATHPAPVGPVSGSASAADVATLQRVQLPAGRPRRRTAPATLAAAVLLGGLAVTAGLTGTPWWPPVLPTLSSDRAADAPGATAPRLSVVVLPLEPEPGSDTGDWFSDPLSADLTANLGQYSGVIVISRETAFTYKGRQVDPREVARELNVRYVVRGTVRRDDNDVRLSLTLIDGETGRQRWADRFAVDRANLRASLAEVGGAVSRSLGVEVWRAEGQRAATLAPEQIEADDIAMRGWAVFYRGLSRENTLEALRWFETAVARDPDSLRGWGGVALTNGTAVNSGWAADPPAARKRQHEAIREMERIDRDDMLTHMARVGHYYLRRDFEGLLTLTQHLIERFPSHPHAHHQQAMAYMLLGRFDDCLEPGRQAIRLGPRDVWLPYTRSVLAFCHFFAGRYAKAAREANLAVEANTALAGPQLILAAALARDGRLDAARAIVEANKGRAPFNVHTLQLVLPGDEPRLAEGRERMLATLGELGVR